MARHQKEYSGRIEEIISSQEQLIMLVNRAIHEVNIETFESSAHIITQEAFSR